MLDKRQIKRVPVLSNGKVIGLVSRSNLIQALAGQRGIKPSLSSKDDQQLRQRVIDEIEDGARVSVPFVNVIVTNGTVDLRGSVGSKVEKTAVRVAAETIAGADNVSDYISIWSPALRTVLWGA